MPRKNKQDRINTAQTLTNKGQEDINKNVEAHLKIANTEMGIVKEEISLIKNDLLWVKGLLEKTDTRLWLVLSGVIITILLQVVLRVFFK